MISTMINPLSMVISCFKNVKTPQQQIDDKRQEINKVIKTKGSININKEPISSEALSELGISQDLIFLLKKHQHEQKVKKL